MDKDGLDRLLKHNVDILSHIYDNEEGEPETLREELDIGNSTAYKKLNDLEREGILRECEDGNGYELTGYGILLLESRNVYEETLKVSKYMKTITEPNLPSPPLEMFRGLDENLETEAPIELHRSLLQNTEEFYGTTPFPPPKAVNIYAGAVIDDETTGEVVVDQKTRNYLDTNFRDEMLEVLKNDGELYVTDSEIEFGVVVMYGESSKCTVNIHNGGHVEAVLVSESEEAIEWAYQVYQI
ncbi:MAG: hypothetical protein SXQ77_07415, partial [Halobacteria archaeon]|nr:hypothetical protein [Halobacteria archaeon]